MGMSDCEECWDTPCTCGHEYRDWTLPARLKQAAAVLGVDVEVLALRLRGIVPARHPRVQRKAGDSVTHGEGGPDGEDG